MAAYIDMKELRAAKRKAAVREKIQEASASFQRWYARNRDMLVVFIPAALSVGGGAVKLAKKHQTLRMEKHLKEDYVYDRSLGRYLKPTRKLSKKEWRIVAQRKANGEKYVNIFNDMGVL